MGKRYVDETGAEVLVTKAGAFGNPSTLKRCRAALKGRSS